jgi:alpha-D-xyloside xylohydrolase
MFMQRFLSILALVTGITLTAVCSQAQNPSQRLELDRKGETIVLEPYAPNILRVTLSLKPESALAAPGYGVLAAPAPAGWSVSQTAEDDVYRSPRMVVSVERDLPPTKPPLQTQLDIAKYFNGSTPGAHITFRTPAGAKLLELTGWSQAVPNIKDGTADVLRDRRPTDPPFYTVGATFASPDDEHYYGLGQNQEGYLDHRGHPVHCWADYLATAAPSFCVPLLVTNKGYGLLWDNPSKTTIEPGFNEQTKWTSQVGDRVSFFVIAGTTADEIYAGYKLLTGTTHMLPKAAYGYIQCKQRYASQQEVLFGRKGLSRSPSAR